MSNFKKYRNKEKPDEIVQAFFIETEARWVTHEISRRKRIFRETKYFTENNFKKRFEEVTNDKS